MLWVFYVHLWKKMKQNKRKNEKKINDLKTIKLLLDKTRDEKSNFN